MGTNYYLAVVICPTCKRDKKIHIGKSSSGWTFSFRGYRDASEQPPIASYGEWLDYLSSALSEEGNRIENEYGEEVSLEDFKRLVDSKRNEKMNHTEYSRSQLRSVGESLSWKDHVEKCWLDEEGNSFCGEEFS